MALPIIMLFVLLALAFGLCYIGIYSNKIYNEALFLSLGGVLLIISGMFLLSSGIQLDSISNFTSNSNGSTSVTYQVLDQTDLSISTIGNIFLFGGVIPILYALVFTIMHFTKAYRSKQAEKKQFNFN